MVRMSDFQVIVIGGGIAGVSVAHRLAASRTVCLVEAEDTLAYHTTGRSAATFLESYGGTAIRALTCASRDFFENAPAELFPDDLLSPLPLLQIARPGRAAGLRALYEQVASRVPEVRLVTPEEAAEACPVLRPEAIELAMLEPGGLAIDVGGLVAGFARGLTARGGVIAKGARVTGLARAGDHWRVTTADGAVRTADAIVDAAGSWADGVAALAGARPRGIRPLRRSVFMVDSPLGDAGRGAPMLMDYEETFYVKPEGDQFLCSPADTTPSEPCDARPDPLEIARAFDEIHEATTITTRHVGNTWAGLRNFAPDNVPVVGWDDAVEGFFWLAGQGGWGIQTSPALSETAACLLTGRQVPTEPLARGLDLADLAPDREALAVPVAG